MNSEPNWVGDFASEDPVPESSTTTGPRRREVARLLAGQLPETFVREVQQLLAHPLFRRREGLSASDAAKLAYERARFVARGLGLGTAEIERDPRRLYALHEWVGLADGVTCTILGIHYCLALGSLIAHGEGRAELEGFIAELERVDSFGVFLATEIGFGNNVASLETEAVYDPVAREFVLSSPTPRSPKFMPNTACAVPKLAVVLARLVSQGKNHGVFPFLVRIRDSGGETCSGVDVWALTEKPGYALDNAVTRFDRVRVPKAHLLAGSDSTLHDDGRFESQTSNRSRRFLNAIDRVQTGRVCFTSTVVSSLRAATWIARRYTAQRFTFAPGKRSGVPLLSYRNVQRDVFGALAAAYALTFAVRHVQERFRGQTPETEEETFRLVATLKAVATNECASALAGLRERCGAAGMFSANRILEFWNQAQGLITAEGDNQLMLLKVGAKLATTPSPPLTADATWAHPAPLSPSLCLALLRFREQRLREDLATRASARRATDLFAVWNDKINLVMAAAEAYGDSLIAECFVAAVEDARDESTRDALATLCALWALGRIERHAGWFLAEGSLTSATVKELGRIRDDLCAETEPHAATLAEAFDFDNDLLQAPIAEPDYVQAYSALLHQAGDAR